MLVTMLNAILFLLFLFIIYFYKIRNFNYWSKKGIKHDKPIPFFGNNAKGFLLKRSKAQLAGDFYRKYPKERVVGFFRSSTPELLIRDPELVKRILVTDFNYFHYRRSFPLHKDAPETLGQHLFMADGDLWRLLRQRLSPAFTSGKLKAMFPLIVERAERLHARIQAEVLEPIDARDLMARFTTDVIGACGFGLNIDALSEETSKFRQLGVKIFEITVIDGVKFALKGAFPDMFKHLKLFNKVERDVVSLVTSILKQRNYEPSGRHDFIDLLLECKKMGTIVGDSIEKFKHDGTPEQVTLEMTDDLLAAQAFVFFAAGFETSSSTSSFTLHLLAYHPDIQRKVQDEIDRLLAKHDNKLSYDAIKEMTYLEWSFKESMRILPSVGFLTRECVRKYTFPDIDLTIDEGVKIMIPIHAMQHDSQYYEKPDEFRPERFDPQVMDVEKTKYVYLPFGDGQRSCIGARLGLMQSMAGLAAVLSSFTVEPAPSSVRRPEVDPTPRSVQTIKAGLPLLFKERKKYLFL